MSRLVLLLAAGCSVIPESGAPSPDGGCDRWGFSECAPAPERDPRPVPFVIAATALVPASDLVDEVSVHVQGLTADERALAAGAAHVLATHCPFHRASMQLPQALLLALGEAPDGVRDRLRRHVDLLEALGAADLPLPSPGDPLHGVPGLVDRDGLREHDPLAVTMDLLGRVEGIVRDRDEASANAIGSANEVMRAATADRWPLHDVLAALREDLRAHRAEIPNADRMLEALELYAGQSC